MKISKEFYDVANSKIKPTDGQWGEGFWAGYTDGAQEMLNAVEQAFKSEVASLKREQERTDNLQYKSNLNQQMEALMLLHFKLQWIKPLNTEQK